MTHPIPGAGSEREDLVYRLSLAQNAACSCLTKTPEIAFHDSRCLYRVLGEAINKLSRAAAKVGADGAVLALNDSGVAWPIRLRADGLWEFADNGFGKFPSFAAKVGANVAAPARLSEEHPGLNVPIDAACSTKLDELGDDSGQGLDPYWKFGFRTGWHYARIAAGAAAETPQRAFDVFPDGEVYERAPAETLLGVIPASVDLNAPGEVNEKLLAYLNNAAQPSPAPIAGDVEKDAWTTWELCQACVKTGFGPLEAQTLLNNLEAARAAMLANSSSGEAG